MGYRYLIDCGSEVYDTLAEAEFFAEEQLKKLKADGNPWGYNRVALVVEDTGVVVESRDVP